MGSHHFLFYQPKFTPKDTTVCLEGDEHHHITRVLRLTPGDEIYVTNGSGIMSRARLDDPSESTVSATIIESTQQPRGHCAVCIPLIKKDRFELALEQCVELGITSCIPFVSERCHLRTFSPAYMERLERIAVSAMKQSFRAWLPVVEAPVGFETLVGRAEGYEHVVFGDPDGPPATPLEGEALVLVGPEAGFTDGELESLRENGALPVSTGRHRLRTGTAAAVLVAAVSGSD